MERIPIINYHRVVDVVPEDDYYDNCVTREFFTAQMTALARDGWRTMPLEEAGAIMISGQPVPEKRFAIAFDDGYMDNFTTAAPILQELGFTATIYLVAGLVGHYSAWDDGKCCTAPLMDWPEIAALRDMGFGIGAHTVTHPDLTQLSDDRARFEIVQSRSIIERRLGQPVTSFCYPYSRWQPRTLELVQEAGYAMACNDEWRETHTQFALARTWPIGRLPHPLCD